MALLPRTSRCTLDWHMFKEVESGDHLLVLPPFYAHFFVAHFPRIMERSMYGFGDTKSGNLPWYLTEAIVDAMPESFWGNDEPMLESSLAVERVSAKNLTVEEKIEQ